MVPSNVPFTDPQLPHATNAEQALLGSLILGESVAVAISLVHHTDFFHPMHAQLYHLICDLAGADGYVSREQVADDLARHPIHGLDREAFYALQTWGTLPGLLELHARDIRSAAFARALVGLAVRLTKDCYDRPKDAALLFDRLKADVLELESYYRGARQFAPAAEPALWQS